MLPWGRHCEQLCRTKTPHLLLHLLLLLPRCKVRAYERASHTFSLLNQDGSLPSRQYVQMACQVRAAARLCSH
jgi:hypothetical protein